VKNISFIGFGELGQQYLGFINHKDAIVNVFDDNYKSTSTQIIQYPFAFYKNVKSDDYYVALGYKNIAKKFEILNELTQHDKNTPNFIHNTSFVNKAAVISPAVFIYPMANIDKNVVIEIGTTINNGVILSHDSRVGKGCFIAPGVIVSGFVEIGDFTFIGSGSIISNNVVIGKNVTIGIGSVITENIPDNSNVIGNPLRFLDHGINL
jgi:sugar O-acyltransferase (sialic acid O-acetyltransferase NeuD family)